MEQSLVWSVLISSIYICTANYTGVFIVAGTEIVTEISWQEIWHVERELIANN